VNWILCDRAGPNPLSVLFEPTRGRILVPAATLPVPLASEKTTLDGAAKSSTPDAATVKAIQAADHALRSDVALAAREATARIEWSVAFGTLSVVALVSGIAAAMFAVQAFVAHLRTVTAATGTPTRAFDYFLRFLLISVVTMVATFIVSALLLRAHDSRSLALFQDILRGRQPLFRDEIMSWLTRAVPGLNAYLTKAFAYVGISLALIAFLVSSCLYQAPDDDAMRNSVDTPQGWDQTYRRYLGRSFGRLKVAIYLGAALLVTTVAEIATQFDWALSFLSADDGAKPVADALTAFGHQIPTEIGFGFSLFLAALYFPAIVILRERGRDFYRTRNPDKPLSEQEQFLTDNGLSINLSSSYTDFLAVLSPLAAGTATHLFSLLGG
jgi:hypothetical protein